MLSLHRVLFTLWVSSILSASYLYLYPVFYGCSFATQDGLFEPPASIWGRLSAQIGGRENYAIVKAPFRLLALGDPQLEGDTSIPNAEDGYFPAFRKLPLELRKALNVREALDVVHKAFQSFIRREIPAKFGAWRKQLDLFGNDYYLAHIYRTLHHFTEPTHVTVLGDLLGSQWIDNDEFEHRGWRFWRRVFRNGRRVPEEVADYPWVEMLGDNKDWNRDIINIAGNHDVGYAGDLTSERIERFERVFGKANYDVAFRLHNKTGTIEDKGKPGPELRIVVLNSLNLDTPAREPELQSETYNYINRVIGQSRPVEDRTTGTILLTHLPLHKEAGICVDGPFFDFHDDEGGNGIKEQNHISYEAGKGILEGIYGMSGKPDAARKGIGRKGIILTGHDHNGCDVYHYLPPTTENGDERRWNATRWRDAQHLLDQPIPGIREITVRSMMGDFGGNAGLLSAFYDDDTREWQFTYSTCAIGVQHIWWATHVLLLVTAGVSAYLLILFLLDTHSATHSRKEDRSLTGSSESATLARASTTESERIASGSGSGTLRKRKV
ncbi:hypothetical protein MMC19_005600 [Ptychographa xylographoides]|nr:hypothetical protein [Ptychographa xylographoides]